MSVSEHRMLSSQYRGQDSGIRSPVEVKELEREGGTF